MDERRVEAGRYRRDLLRIGLDQTLLKTILKVKPKKVVYVSCNPSTLAKDIAVLDPEYRMEYMQQVNMFP
jgi:23S rRNA (uracil1939-C5)-methyltransferase